MLKYTQKEFDKLLKDTLISECGVTLDVASENQIYRCLATIVRQIMSDQQKKFQARAMGEGKKQVYYLCMEDRQHLCPGTRRGPWQRRPGPPGRLLPGRHGHRLHPGHRLFHPV